MSLTAPSSAIFGHCQPAYAERGLATFPVRIDGADKIPATRGWQRTGLRGSAELAKKFPSAAALGIALNQRRMVVDVDSKSESALADVLAQYGDTPLISRTASKGGFHVYYGENSGAWRHYKLSRRAIRPEPHKPVDYLGSGFAVVPPSATSSGRYEFIRGDLDDIARLPPFGGVVPPFGGLETKTSPTKEDLEPAHNVSEGARNRELFSACMRRANSCSSLNELLAFARDINSYYRPPMDDAEVIKIAKNAWRYTARGENRFGQHGVYFPDEEIATLVLEPDVFALLGFLRAANGPRAQFMVANGLTEKLNWTLKRLQAARKRLIELNHIEEIQKASNHKPALYQWLRLYPRNKRGGNREGEGVG
jgi:hypothetical protein